MSLKGYGQSAPTASTVLQSKIRLESILTTFSRWQDLCRPLDNENYYKQLGDHLMVSVDEIRRLEIAFGKDPTFSPTEFMLRNWLPKAEATVDRLLDILTEIDNASAKEEVVKWILKA